GIGATALGSSIGVIVGLASGYLSGWVDLLFQRITDVLQALPLLVLALVMTAALGPSLPNVIIAIAIPLIPTVARVIRANTLALRELPFVEAAKSIGMSEMRIALRHVLPNTLAPLINRAPVQAQALEDKVLEDKALENKILEDKGLEAKVLEVRGLQTVFFTNSGLFKAVDDVSFDVRRGETLAIVGESGCGKSVSALSIMRLVPNPPGKIVGGSVTLEGTDLLALDEEDMRGIRGNRMSMIFQEPMT